MTEGRKSEDTICPFIYAQLVAQVETFSIKEIRDKNLAACLGPDCQMFNVHFRGCGLRHK